MKKLGIGLILIVGLILVLVLFFPAREYVVDIPVEVDKPAEVVPAVGFVPEEGATLLIWESPEIEAEFIEYAGQRFYEKYGIEVALAPVPHTEARGQLALDGPAGFGADVLTIPHDQMGLTVAMGLVLPNLIAEERIKRDFLPAAVDGVTFEGVLYGFPMAIETYALLYNRDIMPEPPDTFAELIEFAKEYNDPAQRKFGFMWDVGNAFFSHAFIAGFGGYVFGDGGTNKHEVGLNSPGAIEGAEFFVSLREILPLHSADTPYDVMDGLFAEGLAAMVINGPWAIAHYQAVGLNFGIAPLPLLPNNERPVSFSGIRTLVVSSFTNYPVAAQMFADFATSDEMLLRRFEITRQIPPVIALMDKPIIGGDELVAPMLVQLAYAVPMPSIPQMDFVWGPYGTALQIMWNDGVDPQKALDDIVAAIEDAIAIAAR